MEKYDDFLWVKRVIDSCTEVSHLRSISRLIRAFYRKYEDWILEGELKDYEIIHIKKMQLLIENKIESKQPIFK